jgi:hypothetical protein
MTRKAATDGGKYNDIISAAYECFFEKGYDGTSVRSRYFVRKAIRPRQDSKKI